MNAVRMNGSGAGERRAIARQLGLALLLVALAGFVDAVGYLALSGLFISFMSGNSTQFATALMSGNGAVAISAALLIFLFLAGVMAGALVEAWLPRFASPAILALEAALFLGVIVAVRDSVSLVHLLPLAFAMGAQNNLRQAVAGANLGSTFVTGALVSTGQGLARHLTGQAGAGAWFPHLASWTALVAGALLGAAFYLRYGLLIALAGPALVTALLAGFSLRRALKTSARNGGPVS